MSIIRPRHHLELIVPLFGTTAEKQRQIKDSGAIRIPVRVSRARRTRNDHNHADTLDVEGEWQDSGIDPRQLTSARCIYWAGDGGDSGVLSLFSKNIRFVGIMAHLERRGGGGQGLSVSMSFVDYTSFFLNQKPYPASGLPPLTATLREAWRMICEHVGFYDVDEHKIVSSVSDLSDALLFRGEDALAADGITIATGTAARFRKLAKVQAKQGSDAWAVWLQCVGMLGLISFFEGDRVIVTSATDLYTLDDPPALIYGRNIADWNEGAGSHRSHKGVALSNFNPLTQTTIEAFYPPPGDERIKAKRTHAKKAPQVATTVQSENYEFFAMPGITDQAALEAKAKSAFEEYARQQVEGRITTGEFELPRRGDAIGDSSPTFNVFDLASGDAIRIQFDSVDIAALQGRSDMTEEQRIDYLVGRNYSLPAATLMAKNFESFKGLPPVFHVKTSEVSLETTSEGGRFEATIGYCNLINPIGGTSK